MSPSKGRATQQRAWLIAAGVYIALALLVRFLPTPTGLSFSALQAWEKLLVVLGIPLVPAVIVGLWNYAFVKNLSVIPRATWIVAFVLYAGMATLAWFLVPTDSEMSHWPREGQLAFIFLMPLIFLLLVPLYGYIYADAKRRGMRYVMWTLLAIFVPDLIGIILYFILRDALPSECATCHTVVLAKYAFCPRCGATMRPICPQCGKALEPSWVNCGYCGSRVPVLK